MNKKRIKKQGKKAFTLVELIAVIVILAVILVIVVPMIGDTLTSSEEKVFKLNAEQAVKLAKMHHQQNFNGKLNSAPVTYVVANNKITQNNVDIDLSTGISDMDGKIIVDANGDTRVTLQNDEFCVTKDFDGSLIVSELSDGRCEANEIEDYFLAKVGTGGLIQDDHGDLRYQGSSSSEVNNYVTFNDEVAGWRIIGLFDVDGVKRIKLVKVDSIGQIAWDTNGVNEWSQSSLKTRLNGTYYNGLTSTAKSLIGDATWYLGGVRDAETSLMNMYNDERGTTHIENPSDGVTRTNTWRGQIALIYGSDARYASKIIDTWAGSCQNSLLDYMQCSGWLAPGLTLDALSSDAVSVIYTSSGGYTSADVAASSAYSINPSIYLIPGVSISGSGTTSDPYVFTKY